MSNSSGSQRGGSSRFKAAMDMSGERISGSPQSSSSSDGSSSGDGAAWSSDSDDVELEKSNILMLGPTGGILGQCLKKGIIVCSHSTLLYGAHGQRPLQYIISCPKHPLLDIVKGSVQCWTLQY